MNKNSKVLALKYRPTTYKDLIGQEIIAETIYNSIKHERSPNAYLFTGIRGVGKTTFARIVAKSLNCLKGVEQLCRENLCENCEAISNSNHIDVLEMDAASKTGVDDVRDLIEFSRYGPTTAKYKIFIIDEVHMLSKQAFNALLKTLEEPPQYKNGGGLKFIFATTEIKKIPVTIISRCQRFDLHRIESNILIEHLTYISEKENLKISNDAMALIVRAADGSVRDGLSLLDQAAVNATEEISQDTIINMLGLANRENIFDLVDKIFEGDANGALVIYNNLYKSGADIVMIFDEMLKIIHFLTQMKIMKNIKDDINIPELERKRGSEIAEKISIGTLGLFWQVLFRGFQELQAGFSVFQLGEMLIIRLIYLHSGPSPDDLIKKIEKKIDSVDLYQKNKEPLESKDSLSDTINQDNTSLISENNKNSINHLNLRSYRHLVDLFYQKKEGMLHTYLYNNVKLISFKEGEIVINDDSIQDPNFKRTVAKYISKWTGRIWQVISSNSNIGKTLYEEDLITQQQEIDLMKNDDEIKKILNKFPKAEIHSITNINETTKEKVILKTDKVKKEK